MKRIAVIHHSNHGNTERFAQAVTSGAQQAAGTEVHLLKAFMDATGRLWRTQELKGRLASAFTVSALPAGDLKTAEAFGRNFADTLGRMAA